MNRNSFSILPDLLYVIPRDSHTPEAITQALLEHPEVQAVPG